MKQNAKVILRNQIALSVIRDFLHKIHYDATLKVLDSEMYGVKPLTHGELRAYFGDLPHLEVEFDSLTFN